MAEKRKYEESIKKREDLEKIASEVGGIDTSESHDEKMQATVDVLNSYHKSEHKITSEHRKIALDILEPGKGKPYDVLFGLYKKLDEKHEKDGNLENTGIEKYLQEFADVIIPSMHHCEYKGDKASKDFKMLNMQSLVSYISFYDVLTRQDSGTTMREIRKMIKEGHGHQAAAKIIGIIMEVKKQNEFESFMQLLFPDDDRQYDFMRKASKKIADDVNKQLKSRKGVDYTISAAKIGAKRGEFIQYFRHYSQGDYGYIEQNAKIKLKKEGDQISNSQEL